MRVSTTTPIMPQVTPVPHVLHGSSIDDARMWSPGCSYQHLRVSAADGCLDVLHLHAARRRTDPAQPRAPMCPSVLARSGNLVGRCAVRRQPGHVEHLLLVQRLVAQQGLRQRVQPPALLRQ